MSPAFQKIAELACTSPGLPSPQIEDSAEAANGHVESKHEAIARACQGNDIDNLIRLATSKGGLLNDELRRKACEGNSCLS